MVFGLRQGQQLQSRIEAIAEEEPSDSRVLPLLHRLARSAPAGTGPAVFANRKLAERLLERSPWRASLHARQVLAVNIEDEQAWVLVALAQTTLGHFRYAAHAYRCALGVAPQNPWYAHNLGHLLDVAIGRPSEAIVFLVRAREAIPSEIEFSLSLAHALGRLGRIAEATAILAVPSDGTATAEHALLSAWLDAGGGPEGIAVPILRSPNPDFAAAGGESSSDRKFSSRDLEEALARGLPRLPLSISQRRRASTLARDVFGRDALVGPTCDAHCLAAAAAYAIVDLDDVPLTLADVAATFRVRASKLRTLFAQLRAGLGLVRDDPRYAAKIGPRGHA